MKFWGIFPKVVLFSFIYAILAFYLNKKLEVSLFAFSAPSLAMVFLGLVLWFICYIQVSRAYSEGKLLTKGCYSKVRHPIYSIWGFLVLPGFSLLFGGFMLFLPTVYWIGVLGFIREEEKALEERFGDEWREYAERTPRFLPRP
ncbi:isoprenylcysteine carboxylmethyltransferase family protein [Thermococcus sp. Bubb.Bath]|uniref:methyltransferase family protein n=1 Tax=Thermococcus sp. Bubb.Bath TaxID=1638242 RepID=UPI0014393262|nr:isoprenylcysteine carboxylmethyltransferase family protein [Thermococcus sp. Bubb.Bath]NJF24633.1 isoprenylcysteine carboxylmethyltransferase family protein [Thermococcus sp. Bubb.Bath]